MTTTSGTTSDNEGQRVTTTIGTTIDNKGQRVTTNGNEWERESDKDWYEWQRMTTSGTTSGKEW